MCFLVYLFGPAFVLLLMFVLVALDRAVATLIELFPGLEQQVLISFFRLIFVLLSQLLNFRHQLDEWLRYDGGWCVITARAETILKSPVFLKWDPALIKPMGWEGRPMPHKCGTAGSFDLFVPVHDDLRVPVVFRAVFVNVKPISRELSLYWRLVRRSRPRSPLFRRRMGRGRPLILECVAVLLQVALCPL